MVPVKINESIFLNSSRNKLEIEYFKIILGGFPSNIEVVLAFLHDV